MSTPQRIFNIILTSKKVHLDPQKLNMAPKLGKNQKSLLKEAKKIHMTGTMTNPMNGGLKL